MQIFFEYLPWIVFGIVFYFGGGVFPATGALMGSMVILLAYDRFSRRAIPQMHLWLAILVWVFGAATLILHDVRFLQWKASVFYWIGGLVLAGSAWLGKKPVLERLLGSAVPEGVTLPAARWRNASLAMGLFYLLLGFVNIWVALNRSQDDWVTFKLWISIPAGIVFTFAMFIWLFRDLLFKESPP